MTYAVNSYQGASRNNFYIAGVSMNQHIGCNSGCYAQHKPTPQYQKQFVLSHQTSFYAPPPAISYGNAYSPYTPSSYSYNGSVGFLASITTGITYSTPMGGGSYPGSLSAYGNSYPYKAWTPQTYNHSSYEPNYVQVSSGHYSGHYSKMRMGF